MVVHQVVLHLQAHRMRQIVGINDRYKLRATARQCMIQRRSAAASGALEQGDTRVLKSVVARDRRRLISRAVVDDQQLPVRPLLPEDALDRVADRALGVPGGADHGHFRRRRAHKSPPEWR